MRSSRSISAWSVDNVLPKGGYESISTTSLQELNFEGYTPNPQRNCKRLDADVY
jgi:hypothetical protein